MWLVPEHLTTIVVELSGFDIVLVCVCPLKLVDWEPVHQKMLIERLSRVKEISQPMSDGEKSLLKIARVYFVLVALSRGQLAITVKCALT